MMYDTDVLIWFVRGNEKAAATLEQKLLRDFIHTYDFGVLPLTENIGHRALVYVEAYSLATGMRSADALIAATAVENNVVLRTRNTKHFRGVKELQLKAFRP
jgi:predicted nucleic acid-binding protein